MNAHMVERRSTGKIRVAKALWYTAPGKVELRAVQVPIPGPGHAQVKTLFTGISRGTERLIFSGAVGESEWDRMRAPLQEGNFPFPVKYGYCAVGRVVVGPDKILNRIVFCLHPHQDVFNVEASRLTEVPATVPARRATLTANMETALNALWDAGAGPADKIVIVGGGIVGLLVASIAARLPGADVTLVDITDRSALTKALGASFATPDQAPSNADIVFHASANAKGLETAIACAGFEGKIVELSWYGDMPVSVNLGGAFHSQRLQLISTQVGHVASARRARWDYARRLAAAMKLLEDPRLDALVADEIAFADLPTKLANVFSSPNLAPVVTYSEG
jgi:2-desacetyl-2-hydroxyethyl bacteriochlorophyllide A dehydrogenase